jgi:hypothetical protein
MNYESPVTKRSKDLANAKVFNKLVKLSGQEVKSLPQPKGLVTRNIQMNCEI